jgi:hypothetical protein
VSAAYKLVAAATCRLPTTPSIHNDHEGHDVHNVPCVVFVVTFVVVVPSREARPQSRIVMGRRSETGFRPAGDVDRHRLDQRVHGRAGGEPEPGDGVARDLRQEPHNAIAHLQLHYRAV